MAGSNLRTIKPGGTASLARNHLLWIKWVKKHGSRSNQHV